MPSYPYRECSTCRVALVPEEIPIWRGSGTEENPHRIERWVTFLKCPQCNKVPLVADQSRRKARSNDHRTWRGFQDAKRFVDEVTGIGLCVTDIAYNEFSSPACHDAAATHRVIVIHPIPPT
jgi:hypothetical protein